MARQSLVRLNNIDVQLRAKEIIQAEMGGDYIVALNLAPTTPDWLSGLGGVPMKLGLDLSGGVHFLLEVDLDQALATRLESDLQDVKTSLRDERIRYRTFEVKGRQLIGQFRTEEQVQQATALIRSEYRDLQPQNQPGQNPLSLILNLSETATSDIENNAIKQNLTSLRNRVNELGVSEPLVSRQGKNRIVVELPGVQDTAEAKRIIGKTANLEFRLESNGRLVRYFHSEIPPVLKKTHVWRVIQLLLRMSQMRAQVLMKTGDLRSILPWTLAVVGRWVMLRAIILDADWVYCLLNIKPN